MRKMDRGSLRLKDALARVDVLIYPLKIKLQLVFRRCTMLDVQLYSLKVDHIAVTSSLRLEVALTRAKLNLHRASNISWQSWQRMEFVVQTLLMLLFRQKNAMFFIHD